MNAFAWYGGKYSHLKFVLPIIDGIRHKTYVESFGGSAAVLLNKNRSPIEVYNDSYGDVVHFFRTLRDQPEELFRRITLTPYSREEFTRACREKTEDDPIERARLFYVRARQVRTGLATTATPGRWATCKDASRRDIAQVVSCWLSCVDQLPEIALRLKEVIIECQDGIKVIQRYDSRQTLHYIDPPYLPEVRPGGKGYAHETDREYHERLLDCLLQVEGKVVLSGYQNDLYDKRLKGWKKKLAKVKMAASTAMYDRKDKQEVLWIRQ